MKKISFKKVEARDWSYWLIFTLEIVCLVGVLGIASYASVPSDIPLDKYLSCPFKKIIGYDCPGCGLTRALISMMHGRIFDVFKYNPIMTLGMPFLLWRIFARLCEILKSTTPNLNLSEFVIAFIVLSATALGMLRLILEIFNIIKPLS